MNYNKQILLVNIFNVGFLIINFKLQPYILILTKSQYSYTLIKEHVFLFNYLPGLTYIHVIFNLNFKKNPDIIENNYYNRL